MQERIEVGQMVFVADGGVGVGAVRETRAGEVVVNIQNAGDFVLPLDAVRDVHSGKVLLDVERLAPEVVEALRHVHDAESPEFAVADPTDGTPADDGRAH
jgi:predicted RecA/RadA family phage recombinase